MWLGLVAMASCTSQDAAPPSPPARSFAASPAAATLSPEVAALFGDHEPTRRQRLLVRLHDPLGDAAARAGASDPLRRAARARDLDGRKTEVLARLARTTLRAPAVLYHYPSFALLAVAADAREAAALAGDPAVQGLDPDPLERATTDGSVPFLDAPERHALGEQGAGVGVVVLDTAVRYWTGEFGTCPERGAWVDGTPGCAIDVWRNYNAFPDEPDADPEDDPLHIAEQNSHGRNVLAIVQAVAPQTDLLAFNVFRWVPEDDDFFARKSDILAALDDVPSFAESHDIAAVNLSLGSPRNSGRPCNQDPYFNAFRTLLVEHGILVTTSSGNSAQSSWIGPPACVTAALSVAGQFDTELASYDGSCTQLDPAAGEVACFSNVNGMVDLVAPGVRVVAGGVTKSGTSMAAPHVAGAIALLQGRAKTADGARRAPDAIVDELRLLADTRRHDGRALAQLDLAGAPPIARVDVLAAFLAEQAAGRIPGQNEPLAATVTIAGDGGTVEGAYLHLEVIHPAPATITVELSSPAGTTVALPLPAGTSNFNALLGKDHLPGVLAPLSGEPRDGTWSLRLTDPAAISRGHLVSARLYWVGAGCTPSCAPDRACGHDNCGGSCGSCAAGSFCDEQPGDVRTCRDCVPDCDGKECGSDGCGGTCGACDDGSFCNGPESCHDGVCESGAPPCQADELDCTVTCVGSTERCNVPLAGTCVIDDACVGAGALQPGARCMGCDTSQSNSAWSPLDAVACDDGDACTTLDRCSAGTCVGTRLDCSWKATQCSEAKCNPTTGGCEAFPFPDGGDCDDDDACTTESACLAGQCVGAARPTCDPSDDCQLASCDPASGACREEARDDGARCALSGEGAEGVCQAGRCEPLPAEALSGDDGCSLSHGPARGPSPAWWVLCVLALRRRWRGRQASGGLRRSLGRGVAGMVRSQAMTDAAAREAGRPRARDCVASSPTPGGRER